MAESKDKKAATLAEQHAAWMRETFFLVEATSFERQVLWEQNSIQALNGRPEFMSAPEHRHRVAWEQLNPGRHVTVGKIDDRPVTVCVFFNRVGGRVVAFYETTSEVVDHVQIEAWFRKEFPSSSRGAGMWCGAGNFHLCLHAIEKASEKSPTPIADALTTTAYAGLFVKFTERAGAAPGQPGYVVLDEHDCNVMPGATYGRTREEALQLIDVLRAVDGDGQKFWHLLRAIQRGTQTTGGKVA